MIYSVHFQNSTSVLKNAFLVIGLFDSGSKQLIYCILLLCPLSLSHFIMPTSPFSKAIDLLEKLFFVL